MTTSETAIRWFIVASIAFYLALFSFDSLTRTRQFSADSMNYVDVARNIATGKGIVQSTLGFNEAFLFDADSKIPAPYTVQGPLYPLLIALLGRLAVSYADAALLISAVAYGIVLFLSYFLSRKLYGEQTALLSLACLLIYNPLSYVSRYAWTESLGTAILCLSLLLMLKSVEFTRIRTRRLSSCLAGLTTGLAFCTRYALLPILLLGTCFYIVERRDRKSGFDPLLFYLIGATIPIAMVLAHNYLSAGYIFPPVLPQDQPLRTTIGDAIDSTFGHYLWEGYEIAQEVIALALLAFSLFVLTIQRRTRELFGIFVRDRHYLLTLWFLGYSVFLIFLRAVHFFDLSTRTAVHAGVIIVLLGVALVVKVIEPKIPTKLACYAILTLAVLVACAQEIRVTVNYPVINSDLQIAQSDRLSWIAQHTTDSDLIVGDGAQDIPFYLGRRAAVSFSAYPSTIHLTYRTLREFVNHNCNNYRHIYLVLRRHSGWKYDEEVSSYGQFIADTRSGNITNYSGIHAVTHLKDGDVFQISCQ